VKIVLTIILTLAVLLGGALAYIYSGRYDISATKPHFRTTRKILDTALTKSVAYNARGITVPDLSDPSLARFGSHHFQEMCVTCHGAPGLSRSEMGSDLYPVGPDLAKAVRHWKPEELYWITRNGIKMTGMPAWGLTTDDHELWALVAFMRQLPNMSPEQYRAMVGEIQQTGEEGGEHH
jgi:mono/diheme cytochrome c family protein